MKYEQPRWSYRISNTKQTMAILRYFVPFLTFIAANSFFRFLGSEGTAIMTAGGNIVLFGILLLILTFFFRKNRFRLSFPLVFLLYISIIFIFHLVIWMLFTRPFSIELWSVFPGCFLVCCCFECGFGRRAATSSSGPFQPIKLVIRRFIRATGPVGALARDSQYSLRIFAPKSRWKVGIAFFSLIRIGEYIGQK